MVRLLGLSLGVQPPKEVKAVPNENGDSGWLIRFFDSAFFCEWIAVSYLYKHDHPGVRDYLCNRMYSLPASGIESYLFQICYMLVHKPSPSLDKFIIDMCSKSLQIALKVHWFLLAELEDTDDTEGISRIQEKCQIAATLVGDWKPLIRPNNPPVSPGSSAKNRVLNKLLSSKQRLLSLTSSSPPPITQRSASFPSPVSESSPLQVESKAGQDELDSSLKALKKKLMPGSKVRDTLFFRKSVKEEEEVDKSKDSTRDPEQDGFLRRILREFKDDDDRSVHNEELVSSSDGFFKRFFRDRSDVDEKSVTKSGEDDDKEGFLKRLLFKEKHEDQRETKDANESLAKSCEDDDKQWFLKRLLFKEKREDQHETKDANDSVAKSGEEDDKDGFFKRLLFKEKHENQRETKDANESVAKSGEDDDKEGFLKRLLFKEKTENQREKKDANESVTKSGNEDDKEGFLKRLLFKEKDEDQRETKSTSDRANEEEKGPGSCEEDEPLDFLLLRRLVRVHPEEDKSTPISENGHSGSLGSSPGTANFFRRLFRDRDKSVEDSELFGSKKQKEKRPGSLRQWNDRLPAKPPLPNNITSQIRKGTYHASLEFVQSLCDTSSGLVDIFTIEDRKTALGESLLEINSHMAAAQSSGGVCFPMGKDVYQVINIPEDEAVLLNSSEKAPYLICVEVMKGEVPSHNKGKFDSQKLSRGGIPLANGDAQLQKPPPWAYPLWNSQDFPHSTDQMLRKASLAIDQAMAHLWEAKVKFVHVSFSVEKQNIGHSGGDESLGSVGRDDNDRSSPSSPTEAPGVTNNQCTGLVEDNVAEGHDRRDKDDKSDWVTVTLTAVPGVNMEDVVDEDPPRKKDHRRVPSTIAIEEVKIAAAKGEAPPGLPLKRPGQDSTDTQPKVSSGGLPKPTDALSGELWEAKKERIQNSSAYGKSPGWDLRSVIVKSGDDCRQEHLAVQLISHFYDIYQEAGLSLWLRPYEVLVTSSYTALIETIPDTASIHAIKSRFPNITSLRDFFSAKFQENSPAFKLAQRNFVESMAGYSVLCYILQVKDRHNGNLLLDEEGHIIHIDFGFMLSNSPGGVNFESAPFKLTRELLEVMDSDAEGTPSEFFDYFKVLCIQGFLTCRKHAERIILLVEMLQDSDFPCFKGGPRTIQNLRKRFHLSLTEEQCVSLVLSLISSSLDAWRTRQYDYYQRVLNGIL